MAKDSLEEIQQCEECGSAFPFHAESCYHSDCDEDDALLHGCKRTIVPYMDAKGRMQE